MSAIGGVGGVGGGIGGGVGGGGGFASAIGASFGASVGGNSWADGVLTTATPESQDAWDARPQSFEAGQVADYRGATVSDESGVRTVTYDKDFDFRGGGIEVDDPLRRAVLEALMAAAQKAASQAAGPAVAAPQATPPAAATPAATSVTDPSSAGPSSAVAAAYSAWSST